MSKRLDDCVMFANWCRTEGLDFGQGAELIRLARRAHAAGTLECNISGKSADGARKRFEEYAKKVADIATQWDGLWPTCRTPTRELRIPDIG